MKTRLLIAIFSALVFVAPVAEANCSGEEVRFSFENIGANTAFTLLANFAGMKLEIDDSISESQAINFDCMHWKKAASYLSEEFDVRLKISNGVMRVYR